MGARRAVRLDWSGSGLRFDARGTEPDTPSFVVDGDSVDGASPMVMLLAAAASCAAIDVVLILAKMRVDLEALGVDIDGTRADDDPKRFLAIHFVFAGRGTGLDEAKLRRAVELSVDKYCSVVATLDPNIGVTYDCRVD